MRTSPGLTVNWRPEVINVAFMAVGRSEQTEVRGVGKGILGSGAIKPRIARENGLGRL
jgi:hypothetical protein